MSDWFYILGPCSLQDPDFYVDTGVKLAGMMQGRDWYYKASFDKANRSSLYGPRGPGLEGSLEAFKEIKRQVPGIRLVTDVHECWQVEHLADVIDCIQIPAFLCRQTDLLVECAKAWDRINVKKGQWMVPVNMVKGLDKIKDTNPNAQVWMCERGTSFGYSKMIVDFDSVDLFRKHFDKTILDCTHATQKPKGDSAGGGNTDLGKRYFVSAPLFNYQGVFAEVHPEPATSPTDGDSQFRLEWLQDLLNLQDQTLSLAGDLNHA